MARVIRAWGRTMTRRLRGAEADRGAGFVEYAGLLLLIAAIVTAVLGLDLHTQIADAIQNAVSDVIG
ncbi:hypothetical protein [Streptomyces sp. YIM 98790]|uniref:hypothetical protein n=1 Tax=Streptomyces sp. YIM 98790 TaxID=2689077 RepID=UPI00140C374D|nr:hypothetical protein [Streptomyces sp. YIM 98790]